MWPVPVLSIMHTWSTMNRFICSWDVHVRRTTSYAGNETLSVSFVLVANDEQSVLLKLSYTPADAERSMKTGFETLRHQLMLSFIMASNGLGFSVLITVTQLIILNCYFTAEYLILLTLVKLNRLGTLWCSQMCVLCTAFQFKFDLQTLSPVSLRDVPWLVIGSKMLETMLTMNCQV